MIFPDVKGNAKQQQIKLKFQVIKIKVIRWNTYEERRKRWNALVIAGYQLQENCMW